MFTSVSKGRKNSSEGHVNALSERIGRLGHSLDERFVEVCRRLDTIRISLIVLTGLYAVQLAGLISLAIVMSRLGR